MIATLCLLGLWLVAGLLVAQMMRTDCSERRHRAEARSGHLRCSYCNELIQLVRVNR